MNKTAWCRRFSRAHGLLLLSLIAPAASAQDDAVSSGNLTTVTPEATAPAADAGAAPAAADPAIDPNASPPTIPLAPGAAPEVGPRQNDGNSPVALEEIVVTARKREEKLQDVPVSITAFNADQLDARGITEVRDLGTAVPGLQFTDLAGYNLIYIRGIGTDAFIPSADPSVATYLDGVYFPSSHSIAQSFGALDRVEVLKGPQGTLFGRNSTGGAVMLWTRDPGPVAETSIQTSYARFDDSKTRVYTNIPVVDDVALSLSAFYDRQDNYYRLDNGTGHSLPPEIHKGARAKLGLNLTDEVTLTMTTMALQQRGTSTTTSANTHPSPILGATIPAETRDYVVTANSEPALTTDTRATYARLAWEHPGVDVRLLGSYYYTNAYDYVYDFDGSSQPIATYGADSDFQRIITSELQVSSNADTWGASWLKWVGGVYYLRSKGGYAPGYLRLVDSVNLPLTDVVNGLADSLPAPLGDQILGAVGGLPIPSSLTFFFNGQVRAESISGYLQTTASLTDWLDLTLGGRWQRETRELVGSNFSISNLGGGESTLIPWADQQSTVHNFSPRASLELRPTDDVMLYASYSQGFKSATYNIINIYTPPDYVRPEKVSSYEVGFKTEWFDRSLRLNAAAFQNDIRDLQVGFVSFTSGGAINFENAGKARSRGIEVETVWQPLRTLDPGLTFSGGATWLDAKYTDYQSGHYFDQNTGLAQQSDCSNPDSPQCNSFDGNRIVRTPKFSGNATVMQRFRAGDGSLDLAIDYYYNSGYYYLAQNSPQSYEPHYDLINARASYLYDPWGLRVTLFGENLGNQRYNIAQFHTDFGREDTLAPPVTYGVRLNWDF